MSRRRIDTLRRVRELQERQARAALAAERAALRRAERAEADGRTLADGTRPAGRTDAGAVQGTHDAVERALAVLATRHAETELVRERVSECERTWAGAARRARMIERLAERLAAAEREEEARRAALELDEIVLTRHGRLGGAEGGR